MSLDVATEYLQNVAAFADLRLKIVDDVPLPKRGEEFASAARDMALDTISTAVARTNQSATDEIVRSFGGEGSEITKLLEPTDLETLISSLVIFTVMRETAPMDKANAVKLQSERLLDNLQLFERATRVGVSIIEQSTSAKAGNTEFAQIGEIGHIVLMNVSGAPTVRIAKPANPGHLRYSNSHFSLLPNANFCHSRGWSSFRSFSKINLGRFELSSAERPEIIHATYENVTERLREESEQAYRRMLAGEPISKDDIVLAVIYKTSFQGDVDTTHEATVQLDRNSYRLGVSTLTLSEYAEQNGIRITYINPLPD